MSDEWTELVPNAHGKSSVTIEVSGGDIYAVSEEQPEQAVPYGQLVREGDTVVADISDPGSLLKNRKPIYARAVDDDASVRTVLDQSVELVPRRGVERPEDTATRANRIGIIQDSVSVSADSEGLVTVDFPALSGANESYPLYVESVGFEWQTLDGTSGQLKGNINGSNGTKRRFSLDEMGVVKFDPGVRIDGPTSETSADTDLVIYNPDAAGKTASVYLNYWSTQPTGGN